MDHTVTFVELVLENFLYLTKDHKFTAKTEGANAVIFERSDLHILIGWYKGEVDIDFYVQRETPILRPNQSRMFRLTTVVRIIDDNALAAAPKFPNYITTLGEAAKQLQYSAELMQCYCLEVLNGDTTIFENITNQQ